MHKADEGGLNALKIQREKLLKNDETVVSIIKSRLVLSYIQTLKEIDDYFAEIRNKRLDKKKGEDEKRDK